jgi:hypothetical protein
MDQVQEPPQEKKERAHHLNPAPPLRPRPIKTECLSSRKFLNLAQLVQEMETLARIPGSLPALKQPMQPVQPVHPERVQRNHPGSCPGSHLAGRE